MLCRLGPGAMLLARGEGRALSQRLNARGGYPSELTHRMPRRGAPVLSVWKVPAARPRSRPRRSSRMHGLTEKLVLDGDAHLALAGFGIDDGADRGELQAQALVV